MPSSPSPQIHLSSTFLSFFIFPNREPGAHKPTFIAHRVAGCLPTKGPLLFFTLWLLQAPGHSLTREPSLKPTLPLAPHARSVLPASPGHPLSQRLSSCARLRLQALPGRGPLPAGLRLTPQLQSWSPSAPRSCSNAASGACPGGKTDHLPICS